MAQPTFDPYATLGISRGADARQVRDAYRRLAREHHPDRSADRRATERMQRINRAWEMLSNPAQRAQYDADVAAARTASTGHWSGAPRRTAAQWAPPPPAWSAGTTTVPGYRPPPARSDVEDGRSGPGVLAALVLCLVLGPLLIGVAPLPVFGLFVLLAARFATRTFE